MSQKRIDAVNINRNRSSSYYGTSKSRIDKVNAYRKSHPDEETIRSQNRRAMDEYNREQQEKREAELRKQQEQAEMRRQASARENYANRRTDAQLRAETLNSASARENYARREDTKASESAKKGYADRRGEQLNTNARANASRWYGLDDDTRIEYGYNPNDTSTIEPAKRAYEKRINDTALDLYHGGKKGYQNYSNLNTVDPDFVGPVRPTNTQNLAAEYAWLRKQGYSDEGVNNLMREAHNNEVQAQKEARREAEIRHNDAKSRIEFMQDTDEANFFKNITPEQRKALEYVYNYRNSNMNHIEAPSKVAAMKADEGYKIYGDYYNYAKSLVDSGLSDYQINRYATTAHRNENAKKAEIWDSIYAEYAKEHPVINSIASTAMNVFGGVPDALETLGDLAENRAYGTKGLDMNAPGRTLTRTSRNIRDTVTEDIDSEFGKQAYNFATSALDSLASYGLAKVTGISALGGATLGLSAGGEFEDDLIKRGATAEQAAIGGAVVAAFETLFETLSISMTNPFQTIEKMSVTSWRDFLTKVGASAFTNLSEEAITEAADIAYDTAANGSISEYSQSIRNYMTHNRLSKDEAKKQTIKDMVMRVITSGIMGGAQGALFGVLGGGASMVKSKFTGANVKANSETTRQDISAQLKDNNVSAKRIPQLTEAIMHDIEGTSTEQEKQLIENNPVAQEIRNANGTYNADVGVKQIVDRALQSENARTREQAQRIQDKINNGIEPTDIEIGGLTDAIQQENAEIINSKRASEQEKAAARDNFIANNIMSRNMSAFRNDHNTMNAADKQEFTNPTMNVNGQELHIDGGNSGGGKFNAIYANNNGEWMVKTGDGNSMKASDAANLIVNENDKAVWQSVLETMPTPNAANVVLDAYDGQSDIQGFVRAAEILIAKGKTGADPNIFQVQDYNPNDYFTAEVQNKLLIEGLESREFKAGATILSTNNELIKNNEFQIKVLNKLARDMGFEVFLFDSMTDGAGKFYNGAQFRGTNRIALSLDAQGGLLLRAFAHEQTHFIAENNSQGYKLLEDATLKALGIKSANGEINEKKLEKALEKYGKQGYESEDKRLEELVADSMFGVYGEGVVRNIVSEDVSLAKSIYNKLNEYVTKAKAAIKALSSNGKHPEIEAIEGDLTKLTELRDIFFRELNTATQNYKNGQQIEQQTAQQAEEEGITEIPYDESLLDFSTQDEDYLPRESQGNGYSGYSMSNNAVHAYQNGEMPKSKWTKSAIIEAVREIDESKVDMLSNVSASVLRDNLLTSAGWHHTSKMFNRTDFYVIDENVLENLTQETVDRWSSKKQEKPQSKTYKADVKYVTWSGTRNYPKATEHTLSNVNVEEKGSFYIITDENGNEILRKKIGSNGTVVTPINQKFKKSVTQKPQTENTHRTRGFATTEEIENKRKEYPDLYEAVEKTSSPEAYKLFAKMFSNSSYEKSRSGHWYKEGRKPSRADYNNLSEFFKKGEQRLSYKNPYSESIYDGFYVETWDGEKWVGENESNQNFSTQDETDAEYMSAIEKYGEDSEQVAKIVERAAEKAGYNSPKLYHGTKSFGFTRFDLSKMKDARSIFLTSKPKMAESYSGVYGARKISSKDVEKLKGDELARTISKILKTYPSPETKAKSFEYYTKSKFSELIKKNRNIPYDERDEIGKALYLAEQNAEWLGEDYGNTPKEKFLNYFSDGAILEKNGEAPINFINSDSLKIRYNTFYEPKSGNYALKAKLGKLLVIDAEGGNWSNIKNWREEYTKQFNKENTYIERDGDYIALVSKNIQDETNKYIFSMFFDDAKKNTEEVIESFPGFLEPLKSFYDSDVKNMSDNALQELIIRSLPDFYRATRALPGYPATSHIMLAGTEYGFKTRDIAEFAKKNEYDSVVFKNLHDNGGQSYEYVPAADVYVIFDPNNVKSLDPVTYDDNGNIIPLSERFNENTDDIRWSTQDSDGNELSKNQVEFFAQSQVRDENGKLKPCYHGTGRADRVGNTFLPERATSGPMAFFTDNEEIAKGYSKSKRDTSIAYDNDYDSYETQFRTNLNGKYVKDIPIYKAWGYLPMDARARITQKAKHVRLDLDGDGSVIYDPNATEANGGWSWQVKEFKGDILKALNEQWLNNGNLFNEEQLYLEVLEKAGVNEEFEKLGWDMPRYMDPNYREESVYKVYLNITNPFDAVSGVTEKFIDNYLEWYEEQPEGKYDTESMEADLWDKNSITAEEFAERMRQDLASEKFTHAWTSIPDSMTDYLKSLGYDGIKDKGGKFTDNDHTVWVPFYSNQIKKTDNKNPTAKNDDIRYSTQNETDVEYMSAIEKYGADSEQVRSLVEKAAMRWKAIENYKTNEPTVFYHGTPNGTFTKFKNWQYFTENKDYAAIYKNQGASSNGYKKTADNPKVYGVYLRADNVFDTRNEEHRKIFENEFFRKWGNGAPLSEKGLPDWTDGDDLAEFFEEEGYNFDAIVLDEGGTGGYGEDVQDRGISIVIKNSNQIKSADPVTYDDNGNIIPLSERFNENTDDIRWSTQDAELSTQDEISDIDRYYAETIAENRAFQMIFSNLENTISSQRTSYSLSQKEVDKVVDRILKKWNASTTRDQVKPISRKKFNEQKGEWVYGTKYTDYLEYQKAVIDENERLKREYSKKFGNFRNNVTGIFDYMLQVEKNGGDVTSEEIMKYLISASKDMLLTSEQLDDEEYKRTIDIRKKLREDGIYVSEEKLKKLAAEFGYKNTAQLRRHFMGRILLTTDPNRRSKPRLLHLLSESEFAEKGKATVAGQKYTDYEEYIKALTAENNRRAEGVGTPIPLDTWWTSLSAEFPEYFDAENYNDMDQFQAVDAFLDITRPRVYQPFGKPEETFGSTNPKFRQKSLKQGEDAGYIEDAALEVATELVAEYANITRTYTDKQKMLNYVYDVHTANVEYRKKLRGKTNAQRKKMAAKMIEYERNKINEYRNARETTERRRIEQNNIDRNWNYVNSRIEQKSKTKHIPHDYEGLAEAFVKAIPGGDNFKAKFNRTDLTNLLVEYRNKVEDVYSGSPVQDEVNELVSKFEDFVNSIPKDNIKGRRAITPDELDVINQVSSNIRYLIDNANKVFVEGKKYEVTQISARINSEYRGQKESIFQEDTNNRKAKTLFNLDRFMLGITKPEYLFKNSGSETIYQIYQDIRKGENIEGAILNMSKRAILEAKKNNHYDPVWSQKIITYKSLTGVEMNMTVPQAMSLYALSKRDQGKQHIIGDEVKNIIGEGISLIDAKTGRKVKSRMTQIDVLEIIARLGKEAPNAIGYVDAITKFLSNELGKERNKVSMAIMGFEKYTEDNYFPITVDKSQIKENANVNKGEPSVANQGASKTLDKKARNAVKLLDFDDVVNSHIHDTAMYCAYASPTESFNRVWNSDIGDTSEKIHGLVSKHKGINYEAELHNMIVAVNGGTDQVRDIPQLKGMMIRAKKAATMGNISVMVQQPTSVFRAMRFINPKYFATVASKADIDEMCEWNGCALKKKIGYFDVNVGKTVGDWLSEYNPEKSVKENWSLSERWKNFKKMDTIDELASYGAEKADEITWGAMWLAAKKQIAAEQKLTGDELNKAAAELFQQTIVESQVYDSVFSKPAYMRSKGGMAQLVTAFMSEPLTSFNMMVDGVRNRKITGTKQMLITFADVGLSIAAANACKTLVQMLRRPKDEDEEKDWLVQYLSKLSGNVVSDIFGMVPLIGNVISSLEGYSNDVLALSSIDSIVKTFNSISKVFQKEDATWDDWRKALYNGLNAISQATGIPVYNVTRDIMSIIDKAYNTITKEEPNIPFEFNDLKWSIAEELEWMPGVTAKIDYSDYVEDYLDGKDTEETQERIGNKVTSVTKAIGEKYRSGKITRAEAKRALMALADKDEKKAETYLKSQDTRMKKEAE